MSITPIQQEFLDFCESQSEHDHINHYTYETCAVGDFGRFKKHEDSDGSFIGLAYELNITGLGSSNLPDAYGDFTAWLKCKLNGEHYEIN